MLTPHRAKRPTCCSKHQQQGASYLAFKAAAHIKQHDADKITRQEWLGIAIGFVGIVLLNVGGSFKGEVTSALLLMFAAASWSFGSVWSKYLPMPQGLMGAASQMLCGGLALLLYSAFQHETWPRHINQKSWWAMAFLVILGSLAAYSAYQYLLKTVRPLVASSNTFVNPVVAFVAGIWLANEKVTRTEYVALAVILMGVFLILSNKQNTLNRTTE